MSAHFFPLFGNFRNYRADCVWIGVRLFNMLIVECSSKFQLKAEIIRVHVCKNMVYQPEIVVRVMYAID